MNYRFWINFTIVLALVLGPCVLMPAEQQAAQAALSEAGTDVAGASYVTFVGHSDEPRDARDVAVVGNYAYVVSNMEGGLYIFDVSDPSNPVKVSFYDSPGYPMGVTVAGNYAYLAGGDSDGLRIIDISNPSTPIETGVFFTPGMPISVDVSGNYAYVTETSGLQIIDVSDPSSPKEVGYFDTGDLAWDVGIAGNYAYVAAGYKGLRIIDISNPTAPTEIGFHKTTNAFGVAVDGNYVYLADFSDGLHIIDVSDPASPSESGSTPLPGGGYDVSVEQGIAYFAGGDAGLRVFDVSNTSAPVETGYYDTPGVAMGVAMVGDLAYVAEGGLMILKYTGPPRMTNIFLPCAFYKYCPDFFDDFSNPASGWMVGEDDYVRYEYLDGEYRVLSKNDQYYYVFEAPACPRDDFFVQVDARWEGSPGESYGILFGIVGDFEQYYIFDINTDYGDYGLWRFDGSNFHTIAPLTQSAAIKPGTATNQLKVIRHWDQINLEINGTPLGTWIDGNIYGGTEVGILSMPYEDEPVSDARFDNFSVGELLINPPAAKDSGEATAQEARTYEPGYRKLNPLRK